MMFKINLDIGSYINRVIAERSARKKLREEEQYVHKTNYYYTYSLQLVVANIVLDDNNMHVNCDKEKGYFILLKYPDLEKNLEKSEFIHPTLLINLENLDSEKTRIAIIDNYRGTHPIKYDVVTCVDFMNVKKAVRSYLTGNEGYWIPKKPKNKQD